MCENDAAVDAWFSFVKQSSETLAAGEGDFVAAKLRAGVYAGVIRELAATVPGVREWLVEHMPGEG